MRSRLIGWTAIIGFFTAGGIFVACKTGESTAHRGSNGANPAGATEPSSSKDGGGAMALFADWFSRDTKGENSGSPIEGGIGVAGVLPAMVANTHTAGGRFGSRGSEDGRPADGTVANDPLSQVCLDEGGSSTEKTQPLFCIPVPQPTMTDIVNFDAAVRLGKALFWDTQVGGDGKTACATCHFSGGADSRQLNTLHPGPDGIFQSTAVNAPGQLFSPFKSIDSDDRVGSQGVVGTIFTGINPDIKVAADNCVADESFPFFSHRRVTGRNTPSVIGAVFNFSNFWDGRANSNFNGYDPFGATGNTTSPVALYANGSLASQAVGPPNNGTEMSCDGRPFNGPNSLASKMIARRPLAFQMVSPTDSVLGKFSSYPEKGTTCYGRDCSYARLIGDAFGPQWNPLAPIPSDPNRVQANFSRLWGQALQAYMSTLVPDQTRYDQFASGKKSLFSAQQLSGLDVFSGSGHCEDCHVGAETTDASVAYSKLARREDQGNDEGYHNLGVTKTTDDLGRAGVGPRGVSWSKSGTIFDRGAFKTPSLRNLKLTAPYFHNGGEPTIEDVVEFYSRRGGDVPNVEMTNELRSISIEDPQMQADLVEFLRNGLLDCRVEKYRAPFDHPELVVPNGPVLAATGMLGTGSCRLSPSVPPTTLNCVQYPGICDTDTQLLATSVYKDVIGRIPTAAEAGGFSILKSTGAVVGAVENQRIEMAAIAERMLGRAMDGGLPLNSNVNTMRRSVALMAEYYTRSGGSDDTYVTQMAKDLIGRAPSSTEFATAKGKITALKANAALGRGQAFDYINGLADARKKRINDLYVRYLRRDATAANLTYTLNGLNDAILQASILQSAEYKALSATRDDI